MPCAGALVPPAPAGERRAHRAGAPSVGAVGSQLQKGAGSEPRQAGGMKPPPGE